MKRLTAKGCPWCRRRPSLGQETAGWFVQCCNAGCKAAASVWGFKTRGQAIKFWNRWAKEEK